MNRISFILILAVAALTFCGCEQSNTAMKSKSVQPAESGFSFEETAFVSLIDTKVKKTNQPLTLKLAINDIYCKETACSCVHYITNRSYAGLSKALMEQFNIELKIEYFPEVYELEKAIVSGKYDGVICKPWVAFMQVPKHKLKLKRLADILDIDNQPFLSSLIMVKKESPIKTVKDLSGKILVTGQPDSYEKYHETYRFLKTNNVKPARTYTKSSCIENIGELLDGKADAAVVSDYVMSASCAVDLAKPEDFRIITRIGKLPLTSVIVDMGKTSEADAARVQQALLSLTSAGMPKDFLSFGFRKPVSWIPELWVENK